MGKYVYKFFHRYGLCIDYNECENKNPCDPVTEDCVNDVGTFICRCKFRYKWSEIEKKCVDEELMIRALKRFSGIDPDADGCACIRTTMYLYSLSVMLLAKYSIALIGYWIGWFFFGRCAFGGEFLKDIRDRYKKSNPWRIKRKTICGITSIL